MQCFCVVLRSSLVIFFSKKMRLFCCSHIFCDREICKLLIWAPDVWRLKLARAFSLCCFFSDNMLTTMCKLKLSNNSPDFCIFKSIFARINLKYRKNSSFLPFLVSLFRVLFWWCSPFSILKTKTTCSQSEAFSIGNLYFLCTTSSSWLQGFFLFSTESMEGQLKKKHPVWLSLTDGENEISAVEIKIDLKIITTQDEPKWKLEWK